MPEGQKSLAELGRALIALHWRGYKPAEGYSFAERTDAFGVGTIEVHAVAIPPGQREA